jgi:hypothetical protein
MVGLFCDVSDICGEPRVLRGGLQRGGRAYGLEYALC